MGGYNINIEGKIMNSVPRYSQAGLLFDATYPNKAQALEHINNSQILLGRYILIDYSPNGANSFKTNFDIDKDKNLIETQPDGWIDVYGFHGTVWQKVYSNGQIALRYITRLFVPVITGNVSLYPKEDNIPESKVIDYKTGLDKSYRTKNNKITYTFDYNNENVETSTIVGPLGNAIESVWDLLYGNQNIPNQIGKKPVVNNDKFYSRNTTLRWAPIENYTDDEKTHRMSLFNFIPSTGKINPLNENSPMTTVAGCINTLQDIIGHNVLMKPEQIPDNLDNNLYYDDKEQAYYYLVSGGLSASKSVELLNKDDSLYEKFHWRTPNSNLRDKVLYKKILFNNNYYLEPIDKEEDLNTQWQNNEYYEIDDNANPFSESTVVDLYTPYYRYIGNTNTHENAWSRGFSTLEAIYLLNMPDDILTTGFVNSRSIYSILSNDYLEAYIYVPGTSFYFINKNNVDNDYIQNLVCSPQYFPNATDYDNAKKILRYSSLANLQLDWGSEPTKASNETIDKSAWIMGYVYQNSDSYYVKVFTHKENEKDYSGIYTINKLMELILNSESTISKIMQPASILNYGFTDDHWFTFGQGKNAQYKQLKIFTGTEVKEKLSIEDLEQYRYFQKTITTNGIIEYYVCYPRLINAIDLDSELQSKLDTDPSSFHQRVLYDTKTDRILNYSENYDSVRYKKYYYISKFANNIVGKNIDELIKTLWYKVNKDTYDAVSKSYMIPIYYSTDEDNNIQLFKDIVTLDDSKNYTFYTLNDKYIVLNARVITQLQDAALSMRDNGSENFLQDFSPTINCSQPVRIFGASSTVANNTKYPSTTRYLKNSDNVYTRDEGIFSPYQTYYTLSNPERLLKVSVDPVITRGALRQLNIIDENYSNTEIVKRYLNLPDSTSFNLIANDDWYNHVENDINNQIDLFSKNSKNLYIAEVDFEYNGDGNYSITKCDNFIRKPLYYFNKDNQVVLYDEDSNLDNSITTVFLTKTPFNENEISFQRLGSKNTTVTNLIDLLIEGNRKIYGNGNQSESSPDLNSVVGIIAAGNRTVLEGQHIISEIANTLSVMNNIPILDTGFIGSVDFNPSLSSDSIQLQKKEIPLNNDTTSIMTYGFTLQVPSLKREFNNLMYGHLYNGTSNELFDFQLEKETAGNPLYKFINKEVTSVKDVIQTLYDLIGPIKNGGSIALTSAQENIPYYGVDPKHKENIFYKASTNENLPTAIYTVADIQAMEQFYQSFEIKLSANNDYLKVNKDLTSINIINGSVGKETNYEYYNWTNFQKLSNFNVNDGNDYQFNNGYQPVVFYKIENNKINYIKPAESTSEQAILYQYTSGNETNEYSTSLCHNKLRFTKNKYVFVSTRSLSRPVSKDEKDYVKVNQGTLSNFSLFIPNSCFYSSTSKDNSVTKITINKELLFIKNGDLYNKLSTTTNIDNIYIKISENDYIELKEVISEIYSNTNNEKVDQMNSSGSYYCYGQLLATAPKNKPVIFFYSPSDGENIFQIVRLFNKDEENSLFIDIDNSDQNFFVSLSEVYSAWEEATKNLYDVQKYNLFFTKLQEFPKYKFVQTLLLLETEKTNGNIYNYNQAENKYSTEGSIDNGVVYYKFNFNLLSPYHIKSNNNDNSLYFYDATNKIFNLIPPFDSIQDYNKVYERKPLYLLDRNSNSTIKTIYSGEELQSSQLYLLEPWSAATSYYWKEMPTNGLTLMETIIKLNRLSGLDTPATKDPSTLQGLINVGSAIFADLAALDASDTVVNNVALLELLDGKTSSIAVRLAPFLSNLVLNNMKLFIDPDDNKLYIKYGEKVLKNSGTVLPPNCISRSNISNNFLINGTIGGVSPNTGRSCEFYCTLLTNTCLLVEINECQTLIDAIDNNIIQINGNDDNSVYSEDFLPWFDGNAYPLAEILSQHKNQFILSCIEKNIKLIFRYDKNDDKYTISYSKEATTTIDDNDEWLTFVAHP